MAVSWDKRIWQNIVFAHITVLAIIFCNYLIIAEFPGNTEETIKDLLNGVKGVAHQPIAENFIVNVGYDLSRLPQCLTSIGLTKQFVFYSNNELQVDKVKPNVARNILNVADSSTLAVTGNFNLLVKRFSWKAAAEKGQYLLSLEKNNINKSWKAELGSFFFEDRLKVVLIPTRTFNGNKRIIDYRKMIPPVGSKWSPGIALGNGEFSWDYDSGFPQSSMFDGIGVRLHWRAGERSTLNLELQDARRAGMLRSIGLKIPLDYVQGTKFAIKHEFQVSI